MTYPSALLIFRIMIKIRLNPTVFDVGGLFAGIDPKRAVLELGTGKPVGSGYASKSTPVYDAAHDSYRGGQTVLLIDRTGTEIFDLGLEEYMKNESLRVHFGTHILDYVQRGYIIVEQDGTALTVAQLNAYTAP